MYRLLIVDDEPGIVDGLYEFFKSNESLELDIYKAYSGFEAIEKLKSMKFDIILSDIRMPQMDGMQLLEAVSTHWPKCKVVFLTGYSEFDYAHKALQHHVAGYILKTEGYEAVLNVVRNAINGIREELEHIDMVNRAKRQMESAIPILRNQFVLKLLQGEKYSTDLRKQFFHELQINLHADMPVLVVVGKVDNRPADTSYPVRVQALYAVEQVFENYVNIFVSSTCVICENSRMVWFLQPRDSNEKLEAGYSKDNWKRIITFIKGSLESIQDICKSMLDAHVSFALSSREINWEQVYNEYEYIKNLINRSIMMGDKMLLIDVGLMQKSFESEMFDKVPQYLYFKRELGILETYLTNGLENEFINEYSNFVEDIKKFLEDDYLISIDIYYSLSLMFLSYINRMGLVCRISGRIDLGKITGIEAYGNWNEISNYFMELSKIIFQERREQKDNSSNEVLNRIHQYINENLKNDISLVKLAEIAYFNPSYLSRFYKQVTGKNISDYINEVRIEKAKELLANKQLKINEVAMETGIDSPSYFTTFFKKLTKITPQEYRDSL